MAVDRLQQSREAKIVKFMEAAVKYEKISIMYRNEGDYSMASFYRGRMQHCMAEADKRRGIDVYKDGYFTSDMSAMAQMGIV